MLEQIANAITFYAFYVETKVGKTGLTVTVDVYRNGTEIVTGGSATEAGNGLYYYQLASSSVTVEGVYIAVFMTATATVDQQHLASAYLIGTAGIEYLDAAMTSRASAASVAALNDLTAAEVWANATRTLTTSAASIAAVVAGSDITAQRGDTLSASLTSIGDISARTKLWFTVKERRSQADSESIIQIEETAGLVYLNGAAGTALNGSITVTDQAAGDLTIALDEADAATLTPGDYWYDLQMLTATGITTLSAARFSVAADVTRSVA